jgi:hypothetical protein
MSSVEITDAFALRLAFLICSTLLTLLDHCNIVRNISLHDTRRTIFVLSELLIWTKYLQYALQRMYEVANEIDEEKETLRI